jgi:hypothetical protein
MTAILTLAAVAVSTLITSGMSRWVNQQRSNDARRLALLKQIELIRDPSQGETADVANHPLRVRLSDTYSLEAVPDLDDVRLVHHDQSATV